ncbi:MAG: IS1182 family transposase [Actinomycetota bacterium]
MAGYIEGRSRDQATLFPERLDDLIGADAPVRVVDAFVGMLKLAELGFAKAAPKATGRPGYDPADLLKLYVYGYLNQIRSSRLLERECHRNVEVLWLLHRLAPDFKTIADFRRDNRDAIRLACRAFVQFCRGQGLFGGELVAIDGSKFAGQNSPDRVWTVKQLEKQAARLDERIADYLARLDAADAAEPSALAEAGDTRAALERLRTRRADVEQAVKPMDMGQVAVTDADARLMRGPHGTVVGYNVQTAVDARHGLIAHHEVTQATSDQNQLHAVAAGAREALAVETLEAVADAGYADAEQLDACDRSGIVAFVPHPRSVNTRGDFFDKSAFVYDADNNTYRCPAGGTLRLRNASRKNQAANYSGENCAGCPLKPKCTAASVRWVTRHQHEAVLDRLAARMATRPDAMATRRFLAEHPFAIIKRMMGRPASSAGA